MSNSVTEPDSPCKGFCTTMLGDSVCKACGRTEEEVLNWIIYTPEEKQAVWSRLKAIEDRKPEQLIYLDDGPLYYSEVLAKNKG